jgi:peroxiredoxin
MPYHRGSSIIAASKLRKENAMARKQRLAVTSIIMISILLMVLSAAQSAVVKGKPAPNFKLRTLDNKTIQLSSYKGKKAVAISFWAVWCPPCQKELPELEKVWKSVKNKPVQILGINVDGEGDVAGNVRENGLTFPIMIDKSGVTQRWGIPGYPTLVVIDKKGIVREILVGYDPEIGTKLPKMLDRYSK